MKTLIKILCLSILWFSCEEDDGDLSCLNTSNYSCLSDIRFKVETDWINGGTYVSGGHYTLANEPLTQEEWNALYGDYNLSQTTATYNNGDSSIIYFLDSLIIGNSGYAGLSEPCPSDPYLYVNENLDSAMVTCTILDYTLLEDSEYYNNKSDDNGNMKHCCHKLAD
tara:strand:+ start:233 stop:733 length:501 start_codon:yes stop_codon:yes gene_type:complete